MNHTFRRVLALAASAMLLSSAAMAESITFDGTVTSATSVEVEAPLGGTVEGVAVKVGQTVQAGEVIATLKTNRTIATSSGTVTAVFAQVGDLAADVVERYGALVYIDSDVKYTISSNINNAYSSIETTYVQAGQTVYLKGRNNTTHTGTGLITSVDSNNYIVEVLTGDFIVGESVNIFLADEMKDSQRIGRGNVARNAPIAVSVSEGTVVSLAVSAGDTVERGDLLFETLSGTSEPDEAETVIRATTDGVIAALNYAQGDAVSEDTVFAVIYPLDSMQIEGSIDESDLMYVSVGDQASVSLSWNEENDVTYAGTVTWISSTAEEDASSTTYAVTVSFTPDEQTRFGMNATVEVGEE